MTTAQAVVPHGYSAFKAKTALGAIREGEFVWIDDSPASQVLHDGGIYFLQMPKVPAFFARVQRAIGSICLHLDDQGTVIQAKQTELRVIGRACLTGRWV